jgi:BirA family biotin operon repressor/biotin-[acetyl-CoA-carboxylase] ligase
MGINVNQQSDHFPSELKEVATSLAVQGKQSYSRASLIAEVMKELEYYYLIYLEQGFEPIRNKWESLSDLIGKKITAKTPKAKVVGIAESLSSDGSLMVRSGKELITIYSADIDKE